MPTKHQDSNLRKVVFSSLAGSIIEWYDFFLYGVAAGIIFNKLYFPADNQAVSTLMSYASFAIGFVARPLGGVVFGHFGDKIGRKKILVLTLLIMGGATMLIGCIPTYESIGIAAPVLLILCRIAQGFGLGGEWGGAVLMTFESAPVHKRAFYASLPQMGMSLGLLLATGTIAVLSMVLSEAQFLSWGWRVAFLLSASMVFIGSYLRTHVEEPEEFIKVQQEGKQAKVPIFETFRKYPKMILACSGARFMDGVFFNIFAVYSITYLITYHHFDRSDALVGVMIAAVILTITMPFWGILADKVGKAKVFGTCIVLSGLATFPAFWLIETYAAEHMWVAWLAVGIPFGIFHAGNFGIMSSLFSESFDASVRYSGISFVYQFAGIFASGITPMLAVVLMDMGDGTPWYICSYVLGISIMSGLSTVWISRLTKKRLASS